MLFVGVAAVRKGLHYALEAWHRSSASADGVFRIAGEILPSYREQLEPMLAQPTVEALGHRTDVPQLMREADVLVLPSIEEGSALVSAEALGSGCVPLVSDMSSGVVSDGQNGFVHHVGDVAALASQIDRLASDRDVARSDARGGNRERRRRDVGEGGRAPPRCVQGDPRGACDSRADRNHTL